MKDAEIQNSNSLTTDDLVLMIGEKEVWLRQKEKQIKALLKKVSDLKRLEPLQDSIKTLSNKNIELDRVLTEIRKERDNLKKIIEEKDLELQKARDVISNLEAENVKHHKNKKRNRSKRTSS